MNHSVPYISFVATSRNDNHGGDLLRRMQVFVNCLVEQCNRYELDAELVLVEWNPPEDRPRFVDALQWPVNNQYCAIRIIEVPRYIHNTFKHADSLPLFQMIGKNVGIRRARGEFVLATNIDVIFSNELMQYFSKRLLKPGVMYRNNRYDVDANVPVNQGVDKVLDQARSTHIRVALRDGTFAVCRDGRRKNEHESVQMDYGGNDEVLFGKGWSPSVPDLLKYEDFDWLLRREKYHLVQDEAPGAASNQKVAANLAKRKHLVIHWPSTEDLILERSVFEIVDDENHAICRYVLGDDYKHIHDDANILGRLRRNVMQLFSNAFMSRWIGKRIKKSCNNFRWLNNPSEIIVKSDSMCEGENLDCYLCMDVKPGPGTGMVSSTIKVYDEGGDEIWRGCAPPTRAWISFPFKLTPHAEKRLSLAIDSPEYNVINDFRIMNMKVYGVCLSKSQASGICDIFDPAGGVRLGRGWGGWNAGSRPMRPGAEIILYKPQGKSLKISMVTQDNNVDSLVVCDSYENTLGTGRVNQDIFLDKMKDGLNVVHLFADRTDEINVKSIETVVDQDESGDLSMLRFAAPHLLLDPGWQQRPTGYQISQSATFAILSHPAYELHCKIRIVFDSFPCEGRLAIHDAGGNMIAGTDEVHKGEKSVLEFRTVTDKTRVFRISFSSGSRQISNLNIAEIINIVSVEDIMLSRDFADLFRSVREKEIDQGAYPVSTSMAPDLLHTNACGDFTLMCRDSWCRLHGYPEWDIYSMHLDSATCFAAHYAGINEQMLDDPLCIYHMEHSAGSGWTPEGEIKLYQRLKRKRIPWLDYRDLMKIAAMMHYWQIPVVYSQDNWGLSDHQLEESTP